MKKQLTRKELCDKMNEVENWSLYMNDLSEETKKGIEVPMETKILLVESNIVEQLRVIEVEYFRTSKERFIRTKDGSKYKWN